VGLFIVLPQRFRVDSLSFNAMLKVISGIEIGAAPGFLFASAVTIWALRRAPRTPMNSAGASSLLLLAFFAFNKQAFGNYYLLVFATTSFAAAMTPTRRQDAAQQPPETSYNRMAA
jgi:hypothetical protein